jgi:lipopolysaccharide transport system permease protein
LQTAPTLSKPVYNISPSALNVFQFDELWQYRHLIALLAWRHIKSRYKQTVLGLLWAVIVPVAFTLIFVIFFRLVGGRPAGDLPYVPSALSGMILWQLFTRGVSEGATSLTANASLITKVYFPRIILPLSAILSALFDVVISLVLLAIVLAWFQIPLQLTMMLAPLFVLQTALIVFAFSLWLSAMDGMYRDLRHALPLILQLGMFISPVAYTTSAIVPEKWIWLYEYNPLVAPLEGFRWALLPGAPAVGAPAEIKSLLMTSLLILTGLLFFARMERTIVDRV